MTTDAACASSAHAIGYAFQQIRAGLIDVAITGGADATLSPAVVQAWSLMRVLSERNDDPQRALRPFSKDREGMVLGEGAGVIVLESEEHAKERGATILAEVTGYGATSDGHHITQPSQDGPRAAIQLALKDAGLEVGQVDYVNAHATATPWNDANETAAIKLALGEHAYNIPVVGIKGAIGHPIAASGALEFVSVVKSIQESRVPPTINRLIPDPECDLDYATEGPREVEIEHAASNSFAFGGSNAVLVASRYDQGR
jgi:3-oxoacyl-(acyl-carrier-protein) synthase